MPPKARGGTAIPPDGAPNFFVNNVSFDIASWKHLAHIAPTAERPIAVTCMAGAFLAQRLN